MNWSMALRALDGSLMAGGVARLWPTEIEDVLVGGTQGYYPRPVKIPML